MHRHRGFDRTSRLVAVGGVLGVAIALAACSAAGGSGAGSAGESQGPPSASAADPAATISAPTTPSDGGETASAAPPEATASPVATTGSVDVDLSTLLPTEIAGKPVTIELGTSTYSFMNLWKDRADAESFLAGLGKSEDDVSLVFGSNSSDFPNVIHMTGYRVAGADGQALGQGIAEQLADRLGPWTVTTETLGGRTVIKLAPDDASSGFVPHYFVVIGDTVVDVEGNPVEWVEEAITKLP